ncbi:TAP42-like protein [Crucibulum laeve]|uniref:TAP42-like protein n=1 Tax=Crucibulum laeve TaxID=68775 RepID=A0A5C3MCC4_9AGAR|nr:TAP42-like protein [Crucibulum laeve]
MSLALPALYARSLSTASKAVNLPTIKDETQQLIHSSLRDLKDVHSRIIELSLFGPNETLEDISTRDLVYLFVPYALSEVQGRVRTLERTERIVSLIEAEKYLKSFFALLENYQIVPEEERALYSRKASDTTDAARRRELKINQFKKEKDIKARIETVRKRLGQTAVSEDYITNFDIIASLLPSTPTAVKEQEEIDSEIEDILRETTLLVLRLVFAQSHSQLESMEQELELLRNAPPSPRFAPPSDDQRGKQRQSDDDMWKLDAPVPTGGPDGKGPLMDANGKPLRPFTILPSDAGERARLQQQVFGPGYNLPTMSIDEYLQIENERGNIITGGGAASQEAPTSSEQLALDAEMDGTREGREKEEQKRQKDEKWARYTDENPKGAGNTMNRG